MPGNRTIFCQETRWFAASKICCFPLPLPPDMRRLKLFAIGNGNDATLFEFVAIVRATPLTLSERITVVPLLHLMLLVFVLVLDKLAAVLLEFL